VIGFTTSDYLMLDADNVKARILIQWVKKRTREYRLGNVLIMRTSISKQLTIDQKRVPNSYCAVFGKRLHWQEIVFHIHAAYEDGIVKKDFVQMRYQGTVTERVNAKSDKASYPKFFSYIRVSEKRKDREGAMKYFGWWKWNREICDFPHNGKKTSKKEISYKGR
jgi:hypothetical protein